MYQGIIAVLLLLILYQTNAQVGEDCTVSNTGLPGTCRISSDCPVAEEQGRNGILPTICGYYDLSIPIVCCISEKNIGQPNDGTFLNEHTDNRVTDSGAIWFPGQDNDFTTSKRKSKEKCDEYSKSVTSTVQVAPLLTITEAYSVNITKCEFNGAGLIVGGQPAAAGEFPFMAVLGFYKDETIDWRCGATLISHWFVLTAAHCTSSRDAGSPRVVRLGELDLLKNDRTERDYDIRRIIVHPSYRYPKKYNDIALIEVTRKVEFNKYIRPACLQTSYNIDEPHAVATGWGKTDFTSFDLSNILMKVSLNIYDNKRCERVYQVTKNWPRGITSDMLCAGEIKGGKDTCQGDSGGPLVITEKGNNCKFYVIGVTSFGKACAQVNTPALYTRVSEYIPWIEDTIWGSQE